MWRSGLGRIDQKYSCRRLINPSVTAIKSFSNISKDLSINNISELGGSVSFELDSIRNFGIIAHIDHGKSTLADRLLEITGNVNRIDKASSQMLDSLKVERERGITVKAQTASMIYRPSLHNSAQHQSHRIETDPPLKLNNEGRLDTEESLLLNLIDTPGHVDFTYEVTRSLSACEGVLLLVDSTQGIQAQTLANYDLALQEGLTVIPVVSKIDLPNSRADDVILQLCVAFNLEPDNCLAISAKTGLGVSAILPEIVSKVPPPTGVVRAPCRARVVDSWFDDHRGVICLIQVVDGSLHEGDRISSTLLQGAETFTVQELGFRAPHHIRTKALYTGQVGYMIAGMRTTRQALLGDTIIQFPQKLYQHRWAAIIEKTISSRRESVSTPSSINVDEEVEVEGVGNGLPPALSGFMMAKPMLFATIYPLDSGDFDDIRKAVNKLTLNDASVTVDPEMSMALGNGLKCGFLGLLHMEVFHQRLQDEFDIPVLLTTPQVPYEIVDHFDGTTTVITSLSHWPAEANEHRGKRKRYSVKEPMVLATILLPTEYHGTVLEEILKRRGIEWRGERHNYDQENLAHSNTMGNHFDGGDVIVDDDDDDQDDEEEVVIDGKESGELFEEEEDEDENFGNRYLEDGRVVMKYLLPWSEVVVDFHDRIKTITSGFASFNYIEAKPLPAKLVKVDVSLNGDVVDALSFVTYHQQAQSRGRQVCSKLQKLIERQQFDVIIQAKIGVKVLARERVAPYRKDVLIKSGKLVGGGDVTRKKKLLEKQKKGKARAKSIGKVELSQEVFWSVLRKE